VADRPDGPHVARVTVEAVFNADGLALSWQRDAQVQRWTLVVSKQGAKGSRYIQRVTLSGDHALYVFDKLNPRGGPYSVRLVGEADGKRLSGVVIDDLGGRSARLPRVRGVVTAAPAPLRKQRKPPTKKSGSVVKTNSPRASGSGREARALT
jgi:hypothetical protein